MHTSQISPNQAFISPPTKIPWFLRLGLWVARRISGADLLPALLLAWYPRAAISSAVLEGLIAHRDGKLDERILKLVRLTVSFTAGCPFCVDMNSVGWEKLISPDELAALQGRKPVEEFHSFSKRESLAIEYARLISSTPLNFPHSQIAELKQHFNEREIVILAVTAAQVNYWTRLIQALGCPPQGVSAVELYLDLNRS
jgi:alkylhydroperoxidase family enzyme